MSPRPTARTGGDQGLTTAPGAALWPPSQRPERRRPMLGSGERERRPPRWVADRRHASGTRSSAMAEPRQQTPAAASVAAPAARRDTGRAAREWWWAGRLMALHGFP